MLCTTATVVRCCRKGSRRPRWESTGIVITHVNIAQPTGLSYLLPLLPIVTTKNIYIYSSDQIYKYILTRSCQELDIYRIFKFPTSWFAWIKQTEVPDSVNMTFCPNDKCDATTIWHRLCGAVGWAPSRVVPKTWASCSALMGGCKGAVHALCCHCLATSAAFTAKATAWPTAQASADGPCRPLVMLRNEYKTEWKRNRTSRTTASEVLNGVPSEKSADPQK